MKKSILFGVMAFFAVSALNIQDVNAQNDEKAKVKKVESVSEKQDKAAPVKVAQEPVKKTDDCCADKKVSTDKKKNADCCADKKVDTEKKAAVDKKDNADRKALKTDGKKVRKHDGMKQQRQTKKASGKRVRSSK